MKTREVCPYILSSPNNHSVQMIPVCGCCPLMSWSRVCAFLTLNDDRFFTAARFTHAASLTHFWRLQTKKRSVAHRSPRKIYLTLSAKFWLRHKREEHAHELPLMFPFLFHGGTLSARALGGTVRALIPGGLLSETCKVLLRDFRRFLPRFPAVSACVRACVFER